MAHVLKHMEELMKANEALERKLEETQEALTSENKLPKKKQLLQEDFPATSKRFCEVYSMAGEMLLRLTFDEVVHKQLFDIEAMLPLAVGSRDAESVEYVVNGAILDSNTSIASASLLLPEHECVLQIQRVVPSRLVCHFHIAIPGEQENVEYHVPRPAAKTMTFEQLQERLLLDLGCSPKGVFKMSCSYGIYLPDGSFCPPQDPLSDIFPLSSDISLELVLRALELDDIRSVTEARQLQAETIRKEKGIMKQLTSNYEQITALKHEQDKHGGAEAEGYVHDSLFSDALK